MKIVIGSESFPPNISGVAVFAERMASFMAKNGHEVYVFAPSQTGETHIDKAYKNYTVVRLKAVKNPFREGFWIALLPASEIRRQLDKIKPDLIHIQDPTSICGALLSEGRKRGIPVLATNHFNLHFVVAYIKYLKPLHPLVWFSLSWYFARFYDRCSLLTTPSPTARQSLIKMGVKRDIRVVSNGVDLTRFKPTTDIKAAKKAFNLPDKPVIIYLGRIDKDKSIDVIIKAMPDVIKEVDAQLLLVGGGDEVPKIKALAEKLNVSDHIKFVGRIEHESNKLQLAYQTASVFAMPSCIETQSIVTLEALASGLPLVAARATSMPEFAHDDKNGYLFTPKKHKEMAKRIVQILKNPQLEAKMRKNSRILAETHSIDKTFKEFEEIYYKMQQLKSQSVKRSEAHL